MQHSPLVRILQFPGILPVTRATLLLICNADTVADIVLQAIYRSTNKQK